MNRKVFLVLFATAFIVRASAQTSDSSRRLKIDEISIGWVGTGTGAMDIHFPKPFLTNPTTDWSFAQSFNLITSKTHHHLMYQMFGNDVRTLSVQLVNGYTFTKSEKGFFDCYVLYQENQRFDSRTYVSLGVEKSFRISSPTGFGITDFIGFAEVGLLNFKTPSLMMGISVHPQIVLWGAKSKE